VSLWGELYIFRAPKLRGEYILDSPTITVDMEARGNASPSLFVAAGTEQFQDLPLESTRGKDFRESSKLHMSNSSVSGVSYAFAS
jgi:hypothetical protein